MQIKEKQREIRASIEKMRQDYSGISEEVIKGRLDMYEKAFFEELEYQFLREFQALYHLGTVETQRIFQKSFEELRNITYTRGGAVAHSEEEELLSDSAKLLVRTISRLGMICDVLKQNNTWYNDMLKSLHREVNYRVGGSLSNLQREMDQNNNNVLIALQREIDQLIEIKSNIKSKIPSGNGTALFEEYTDFIISKLQNYAERYERIKEQYEVLSQERDQAQKTSEDERRDTGVEEFTDGEEGEGRNDFIPLQSFFKQMRQSEPDSGKVDFKDLENRVQGEESPHLIDSEAARKDGANGDF